jgi:hypothetical protein
MKTKTLKLSDIHNAYEMARLLRGRVGAIDEELTRLKRDLDALMNALEDMGATTVPRPLGGRVGDKLRQLAGALGVQANDDLPF